MLFDLDPALIPTTYRMHLNTNAFRQINDINQLETMQLKLNYGDLSARQSLAKDVESLHTFSKSTFIIVLHQISHRNLSGNSDSILFKLVSNDKHNFAN